MILDKKLEIASGVTLDQTVASVNVGDTLDMTTVRDLGAGEQLFLVIQIVIAVLAAGGAANVQFSLVSDSQAPVRADGNEVIHLETGAIPKATLAAGYQIVIPLPPQTPAWKRYVGVVQTTDTHALTAGTFNAFITKNVKVLKQYSESSPAV